MSKVLHSLGLALLACLILVLVLAPSAVAAGPGGEIMVKSTYTETGCVARYGSADWAITHDSPNGNPYETQKYFSVRTRFNGEEYSIYRGRLMFPTQAVPDDRRVKEATVSIKVKDVVQNQGEGLYLTLVGGEGMGTQITVWDYGALLNNATPLAETKSIGDMTPDGWIVFHLTREALSSINATGYTLLGLRISLDVDDVPPTLALRTWVDFYSSGQYALEEDKPQLWVRWN